MLNILSDDELTIQFQIVDFVRKTQQQIVKDFGSSGIQFDQTFETEEWTLDQIIAGISIKLDEVISQGESKLLQLLYQIDIPQNEFLNLVNKPDFSYNLSALILKREAFKVFLRSKF